MKKRKPDPAQLDLFAWAAARPTAKVISAHTRHREAHVARAPYAAAEQSAAHFADVAKARMSAALLMPREPVRERVGFSQHGQILLDFLRRGVRALDVPHHLLPQQREPCGAINVPVSRSFKVEGREPHGDDSDYLAVEFAEPPFVPVSDLTLSQRAGQRAATNDSHLHRLRDQHHAVHRPARLPSCGPMAVVHDQGRGLASRRHAQDRLLGFNETDGNFLCIPCLEARLGRKLMPADFADVPVNKPSRSDTPLLAARKLADDQGGASVFEETKLGQNRFGIIHVFSDSSGENFQ
ncbi:hypothetical protein [Mesorhizobium onobrychidis]|uniref:Uncharacterized protein n=1 Tax=Mesorhizobium onobrychidis TaxID=2775404 RepID=A0ABY5QPB2_9HYPH|nr:hypothetical protein [Mesorhizobium onobrychidis]UVC12843.1 hypothetical protein IHQ72_18905 [Mesorhizobium onobrychidis]